jgi:hypothetical protein
MRAMRNGMPIGGLIVIAICAGAASQAAKADDIWPCVQRRTATISAAAVWSGPDLAQAGAWDEDQDAAALARKLASRRTAAEDMDGLLDDFTAKAGADKDVRLTRVFAGALELINAERDRVLSGIARYARGQNRLAEQVRHDSEAVADAQEAGEPFDEALTRLKWDKRIFDERSQSLTYVCETPKILESRAFEIARRIQQKL